MKTYTYEEWIEIEFEMYIKGYYDTPKGSK